MLAIFNAWGKVFAIPLSACFNFNLFKRFVQEAFKAAEKNPILIDKFIDHAMEVDVDAISDG